MFCSKDFKHQPTCNNCKHADLYLPYWVYLSSDPRCRITRKVISPDYACEHFERLGRNCR